MVLWPGLGEPVKASTQSLELDLRRAHFDAESRLNPESGVTVPAGMELSASYVWASGVLLTLGASRGSEVRYGAMCGGVTSSVQCPEEIIDYAGGLVALGLGWRLRTGPGSWWWGIRPEVGLGVLWRRDEGRDTGIGRPESAMSLHYGMAVEGGYRFPQRGLGIRVSAGLAELRPQTDRCSDCYQRFDEALPHVTFGAGLSWDMP
jgi:hypothetical protein